MPAKTIERMSQTAIKVTHNELKEVVTKYYMAKRALFIWGIERGSPSHPNDGNREILDDQRSSKRISQETQQED